MGSPSQSFVLGFTPLQVARRPSGEGGVYEPATGDELTQLQRLIDYGVITRDDVAAATSCRSRSREGTRAPRNDHELNAQAYMVGNCAHCHNPRGFPSIKQPELADVLIFLPGPGPNQGIFQFPLDAMSPIRKRGLQQDVPIPYITPSLYDLSSDTATSEVLLPEPAPSGSCDGPNASPQWVLAPWRSLIYRNVDTPFDYFDDFAPFPHMPLNTPGYDCRVAQLMGDWMVSIPARIKDPTHFQNALPVGGSFPVHRQHRSPTVRGGSPGRQRLRRDGRRRLPCGCSSTTTSAFATGSARAPTRRTSSIPSSQAEVDTNVPVQTRHVSDFKSPTDPNLIIMPPLTPVRPHYVAFDDTDAAGRLVSAAAGLGVGAGQPGHSVVHRR